MCTHERTLPSRLQLTQLALVLTAVDVQPEIGHLQYNKGGRMLHCCCAAQYSNPTRTVKFYLVQYHIGVLLWQASRAPRLMEHGPSAGVLMLTS